MCSLFVTDPEWSFFVFCFLYYFALFFVICCCWIFVVLAFFFGGGGGERNVQFRVRIHLVRRNQYASAFLKHCNC